MQKLQMLLLGLGAVALGLLAYLFTSDRAGGPAGDYEVLTVFSTARPLPDFSLLDHRGQEFTAEGFSGRWSILFFGFTHCPDICPTTLYELARLRKNLQDLPEHRRPAAYLVSVDVARDTPEVMARYVKAFDASFTGVTGSPDELKNLAGPLGVAYGQVPAENGGYEVLHTASLFLLDPQGNYVAVASPPHDIEKLADDYRALISRGGA